MKRPLLALACAAALGLSGCGGPDCADLAAKLPAGMVHDFRDNSGTCQVQIHYADGTPGNWFDVLPLVAAAEKAGVDR